MPQIVEKISIRHKLSNDIIRRLSSANTEQLNEIRMLHLLHDSSLGQELIETHGLLLEGLDSDDLVVSLPDALVHVAVLSGAELGAHLYLAPVELPLVGTVVEHVGRRERVELRLGVTLRCRVEKVRDEPVCVL